TLLLTFFILLFSMSTIDAEKWEALVESFANEGNETSQIVIAPEGEGDKQGVNKGEVEPAGDSKGELTATGGPVDMEQLYEYLKNYVEQQQMGGSVSVEKSGEAGSENVMIRFSDNIFFEPDKSDLKPGAYAILDFLGQALSGVTDQILAININGYTADLLEMTSYPVNDRVLSAERAASVAVYLEEKQGMDPSLMIASGFGRLHPVADNATAEGRSKNRRVDVLIVSNKDESAGYKAMVDMLTGGSKDDSTQEALPEPSTPPMPDLPEEQAAAAGNATADNSASATAKPKETAKPTDKPKETANPKATEKPKK
ncbi:MAG: OmpA family protein, partial [Oscillospiraceae bacterium]